MNRLDPKHLEDLQKSGLNEDTINACGFYSADEATVSVLIGYHDGHNGNSGMVIPFQGCLGYCRVKPDAPTAMRDGSVAKYLSPIGKSNRLYVPQLPSVLAALKDLNAPLIITEGEKKAAKASQEGFCCLGLVGNYGWKVASSNEKEDASKDQLIGDFDKVPLQGRVVYIIWDSDSHFNWMFADATARFGCLLQKRGAVVKLARLKPAGWPEKAGIDDWFVAEEKAQGVENARTSFQGLLNQAEALPKEPKAEDLALDSLMFGIKHLPDVSGSVLQSLLQKILDVTRCLTATAQDQVFDALHMKTGLTKVAMKEDLQRLYAASASKEDDDKGPATITMTDEERAEAEALLKDPNLVDRFLSDVEKLGLVGEKDNALRVFLACHSRMLKRPLNLLGKGDSSGGKSTIVRTALKFFPDEKVKVLTRVTPQALNYMQDDLANSIMFIQERDGAEDAAYSLRIAADGDDNAVLTVEKTEEGKLIASEKTVKGPFVIIQTTTRAHLDDQDENRSLELFVDESESQTQAIHDRQRSRYLEEPMDEEKIVRAWRNASRLLELVPVVIPFVDQITFPTKPLRVRRDFQKFLKLIEISALLHQKQRARYIRNDGEHILASKDDYAIAHRLFSTVLGNMLRQLTPSAVRVLAEITQHKETIEASKIEKWTRFNRNKVNRALKELDQAGYIALEGEVRKGVAKTYVLTEPEEITIDLVHPDKIRSGMDKILGCAEAVKTACTTPTVPIIRDFSGVVHWLDGIDITEAEAASLSGRKVNAQVPQPTNNDVFPSIIRGSRLCIVFPQVATTPTPEDITAAAKSCSESNLKRGADMIAEFDCDLTVERIKEQLGNN